MKKKSAQLVYSITGKMESVGKWGSRNAKAIIPIRVALPKAQSLMYSSTGPILASFTY